MLVVATQTHDSYRDDATVCKHHIEYTKGNEETMQTFAMLHLKKTQEFVSFHMETMQEFATPNMETTQEFANSI